MRPTTDWWSLEGVAFAGQRSLLDAAAADAPESRARAIARAIVLDVATSAIHDRPAELAADVRAAWAYLAAAGPEDRETAALTDCLEALARVGYLGLPAALHAAARMAAAHYAPESARSFAELSYQSALSCGSWADAHQAASILERLAELDECPRSAERWRRNRRHLYCWRRRLKDDVNQSHR